MARRYTIACKQTAETGTGVVPGHWTQERKRRDAAALAFVREVYDTTRALALLDTAGGWRTNLAARRAAASFERGDIVGASVEIAGFRVTLACAA